MRAIVLSFVLIACGCAHVGSSGEPASSAAPAADSVQADPAPAQEGEAEVIRVKVGEKKSLTIALESRVTINNTTVANLKVAGAGQIEVIGISKGSTRMVIEEPGREPKSFTVEVNP